MTDAHLHLDGSDTEACGASAVCVCSASVSDWSGIARVSGARTGVTVVPAFGVHPSFARNLPSEWQERMEGLLRSCPDAAVGEIGLDGCEACPVPLEEQLSVLKAQLELAERLARPVVLHGAKAWGRLADAIAPYAGRLPAVVLHGFGASLPLMRRFAAMDSFFSFGPMLCNDRALRVRECFLAAPDRRMLLESDAPNRQGVPLEEVYRKAASLRDISGVDRNFGSAFGC